MSGHQQTERRAREDPPEDTNRNGHNLIEVVERVPGREPTNAAVDLTAGPPHEYRTRYWRCWNCGQERNRRSEFRERCEVEEPPTPLGDGGCSIEDARTRRALTEDMDVRFAEKGPVYEVGSQSGNTYEVDVEARTCTCPDFQQRNESLGEQGCKHLRRVTLEIRTRQLPTPDGSFRSSFSRL